MAAVNCSVSPLSSAPDSPRDTDWQFPHRLQSRCSVPVARGAAPDGSPPPVFFLIAGLVNSQSHRGLRLHRNIAALQTDHPSALRGGRPQAYWKTDEQTLGVQKTEINRETQTLEHLQRQKRFERQRDSRTPDALLLPQVTRRFKGGSSIDLIADAHPVLGEKRLTEEWFTPDGATRFRKISARYIQKGK